MYKVIVWTLTSILLLIAAAIGFLQTSWAKEKTKVIVFEALKKDGIELSIESIEGGPPFKWTLKNVHLQMPDVEVKAKTVWLRVSIIPLLRKELGLSYFRVDEADVVYRTSSPQKLELKTFPWSLSFKSVKIETLRVKNLETSEEGTYTFQGNARIRREGKSFSFEGKLSSPHLFVEASMYGNKKSDTMEGHINADIHSKEALAPFATLPINTNFSLNTTFKTSWTAFPQLSCTFSLKSDVLCAKGEGVLGIDLFPHSLKASFLMPHLSQLVPGVGGIVNGEISYTDKRAHFTFDAEKLEIGPLTYTDIRGHLEAKKEDQWLGTGSLHMEHLVLPVEGSGAFSLSPEKILSIQGFQFNAPQTKLSGDLHIDLPAKETTGGIFVQITDLATFSPFFPYAQIGGNLGGKIEFLGKNIKSSMLVRAFRFDEVLSQEVSCFCELSNLFSTPQGEISIEGKTTYLGQLLFDRFACLTHSEETKWPFSIEARGSWKDPLELLASGSWSAEKSSFDFHLDHMNGTVLQKQLRLEKPCSLHWTDKAFVLTECRLDVGGGYLLGSMNLSTVLSKIHLKAEHFPIDLFTAATTRFTLKGESSIDVALQATPENLQGRVNVLLENADILQAGKRIPIQSKGSLQINLDNGVAQVHGKVLASNQQFLEVSSSLPITYQLFPLVIGIDRIRPIAGELTLEGHLQEIFDFINIGSHRIEGLLSAHFLLSKNLASPQLLGNFEIQKGAYENYFIGLILEDIHAQGKASGNHITLNNLAAKDEEEGLLTAKGTINLNENLDFNFDAKLKNLKTLQLGWLGTAFTGPVNISGSRHEALAKGDVIISRADIKIPDDLPIDLPILPVTFIHEPIYLRRMVHVPEPAFPFHYDAVLRSSDKIYLTGRGLDAELEGNLHVVGTNLAVEAEGSLRLVKGKFSFAGKDFTLTQGELTFPSSYLNLTGTLALPDLNVTAMLRGELSSPQLTFQSSPAMPTSSILSHILFNKDVSELSATQALQLADTIVTLSGGAGPSVLEAIRSNLGIDRLNIVSSPSDPNQVSVQIGKYLTKGVMITLSQSTQSSQVIVEVQLKGGFVLQAETQEDDQAKFSFKWNKNY